MYKIATTILVSLCIVSFSTVNIQQSNRSHEMKDRSARKLLRDKKRIVRTKTGTHIYLVDETNVKRDIPDAQTFSFLGLQPSDIETVSEEELSGMKTGQPVLPILEEANFISARHGGCPCKISDKHHSSDTHNDLNKKICIAYSSKIIHGSHYRVHNHQSSVHYSLSRTKDVMLISEIESNYPSKITQRNCLVIAKISSHNAETFADMMTLQCPGTCLPIPVMEIPLNISILSVFHRITCSSTIESLSKESLPNRSMISMLRLMAIRRIQECSEQKLWPSELWPRVFTGHDYVTHNVNKSSNNKSSGDKERPGSTVRAHYNLLQSIAIKLKGDTQSSNRLKVGGLIIWVGSVSRLELVTNQLRSLSSYPSSIQLRMTSNYSHLPIVGWVATEREYPCQVNTTQCEELNTHREYQRYMPQSEIDKRGPGWGCAQRRPLRALAHALLLFDPGFVLMADDDTFVNIPFLLPNGLLFDYIHETFATQNTVVSELCDCSTYGRKMVSQKGFLLGGAGYLISRTTLDKLESHYIAGPTAFSDTLRSKAQMKYLSLLRLASSMALKHCPSCISFQNNQKEYLELGSIAKMPVRVVDICTNLLSSEKTCHHSDHALSRCVVHGVYSNILSADCQGGHRYTNGINSMSPLPGNAGMCQESPKVCNISVHFTCHRMMPNPYNLTQPVEAGTRKRIYVKPFNESRYFEIDEYNRRHEMKSINDSMKIIVEDRLLEDILSFDITP